MTTLICRYQEDMTDVFERCQRKEAQRLQTIKDTMFSIHKCLNIAEDPTYVAHPSSIHNFQTSKQQMIKEKSTNDKTGLRAAYKAMQ